MRIILECDINYTYKDNESRKLEGDNITVYGELNGTAKSETILGKQVIYPYVDIETDNQDF